jgi:hypothetical protein
MSPPGGELRLAAKEKARPVPNFAVVGLIATLIAGAALWGIDGNVLGLFHDDAIYVAVAKSLSEGEGYRIASLPTNPPQTKYPFLYSFVLSCLWQINPNFPHNIFLLKSFNAVLLAAIFVCSYVFYKAAQATTLEALLYGILVSTNPAVFSLTDFTLSDLLFMLLTLLGLCLCQRPEMPNSKLHVAALSTVVGLACLTRPAAACLALSGAIFVAARGRYVNLILYVAVLLALTLPWLLWVAAEAPPNPNALVGYYLSHDFRWHGMRQVLDLVLGNLAHLYSSLKVIFLSSKVPGLQLLICLVIGVGLCRSFRMHNSFFWVFVGSYFILVLVWPFHPLRYTLPLVPVMMLFLFRGNQWIRAVVRQLIEWSGPVQINRLVANTFVCVLFVLNFAWLTNFLLLNVDDHTRGFLGRRLPYAWSGFVETFDWVRQNTDKSDILATGYDPMYYQYTGRRAIRPGFHRPETYFYPYRGATPNIGTTHEVKQQLDLLGVRYLIIDPLDGYAEREPQMKIFDELLQAYPTSPELVFKSSDLKHRIYRLPLPG